MGEGRVEGIAVSGVGSAVNVEHGQVVGELEL